MDKPCLQPEVYTDPSFQMEPVAFSVESLCASSAESSVAVPSQTLKALKIRVSVIGLSAEVRVCTVLTRETGGTYHVCLDESHFRELLMFHVKPPPANAQSECSLIRMGRCAHVCTSQTLIIKGRSLKDQTFCGHLVASQHGSSNKQPDLQSMHMKTYDPNLQKNILLHSLV